MITLIAGRRAPARPRNLTKLVRDGRLKLPDSVGRELRKKDDPLKNWVTRHWADCVLTATDQNIGELARISRDYSHYLGDDRGAADPVVICMAIYLRSSDWIVLADDAGIQAVCVLEGIQFVTSSAFCRIEGI